MAQQRPDLALAQIGLTNVYYRLARKAEPTEEQSELFQRSVDAGHRAIELDPRYFQTYWNTFLALLGVRRTERGSEADLTREDWQELLELADQSLRYNGLQPETLNAGAYAHMRLFERDADATHLTEATGLISRAIRLTRRVAQGDCALPEAMRHDLSDYYDTLRELQELSGDSKGALATARTALGVLDPTDPDIGKRTEQMQRLEGLISDGN
jgi:hypothetical protein